MGLEICTVDGEGFVCGVLYIVFFFIGLNKNMLDIDYIIVC